MHSAPITLNGRNEDGCTLLHVAWCCMLDGCVVLHLTEWQIVLHERSEEGCTVQSLSSMYLLDLGAHSLRSPVSTSVAAVPFAEAPKAACLQSIPPVA